MARKLASSYNPDNQNEQPVSREEHLRCHALDCKLAGAICTSGDRWLCSSHWDQPEIYWPFVTKTLNENWRLQRILMSVNALVCDEFDRAVANGTLAVEDMIKPELGECHAKWQWRVKTAIHLVLKALCKRAIEQNKKYLDKRLLEGDGTMTMALHELTSGALLNPKTKPRDQQLKELGDKQSLKEQAA